MRSAVHSKPKQWRMAPVEPLVLLSLNRLLNVAFLKIQFVIAHVFNGHWHVNSVMNKLQRLAVAGWVKRGTKEGMPPHGCLYGIPERVGVPRSSNREGCDIQIGR